MTKKKLSRRVRAGNGIAPPDPWNYYAWPLVFCCVGNSNSLTAVGGCGWRKPHRHGERDLGVTQERHADGPKGWRDPLPGWGGAGIWLGLFGPVHLTTGFGTRKDAGPATCMRWWDQPWEGQRSGSELAGVSVMKPTNLGEGDHISHLGRFNGARVRAVVGE